VPTYLVERYWPGVTIERLLAALERSRRVIEEMTGEGTPIRDVSCTLIPGEEVVFSVYDGPSAIAVRQLNRRAGIPISRIVEAIAVTPDRTTRRQSGPLTSALERGGRRRGRWWMRPGHGSGSCWRRIRRAWS
jgi:hypothetical protein